MIRNGDRLDDGRKWAVRADQCGTDQGTAVWRNQPDGDACDMDALDGVSGDGFEHPGEVGAAVDVVAVQVEKQDVGAAEAFGDGV